MNTLLKRFFSVFSCTALILLSLLTTAYSASSPYYTEPATGMQFVRIPGGAFTMGDHTEKDSNALPLREVTVPGFYMGKFEVTFEQYDQYCEEKGREKPADEGWGRGNRPVINVSWHDAVAFTQWLSEKSGKTIRLPSEAEWEYAARSGGLKVAYPWGNEIGKNKANCRNCGSSFGRKMTAPVGSFDPNPYGLYDMGGNVYEWTADTFHFDYQGAPADGSAWLKAPKEKGYRMNRSGSWARPDSEIKPVTRCWDPESTKNSEIGLRVVMEP